MFRHISGLRGRVAVRIGAFALPMTMRSLAREFNRGRAAGPPKVESVSVGGGFA